MNFFLNEYLCYCYNKDENVHRFAIRGEILEREKEIEVTIGERETKSMMEKSVTVEV